jgi:hypothetical protein
LSSPPQVKSFVVDSYCPVHESSVYFWNWFNISIKLVFIIVFIRKWNYIFQGISSYPFTR